MSVAALSSRRQTPPPAPLFLETTIHGERIFGTNARREAIKANTAGKALSSSSCVLGEFIATFVRDAALISNLLVDSASTDEAFKRAQDYPLTTRQSKRMVKVLAEVARCVGYDRDDLLDYLELLIEWGLLDRFSEGLISYSDATGCVRAKARFTRNEETQAYKPEGLSCTKNPPPQCSILAFLLANREGLQSVIGVITPINDPELSEMAKIAQITMDNRDLPFGRNCQKLRDIIIALEAPNEGQIYTTNLKHFQPICAALQKTIYKEQ